MANFPDDIIFEILSRLPIVSLCRFRCVSKPWRLLISHPFFIEAHFNRNTYNKHERLILGRNRNLYSVELESSQFGHQSMSVHLNFPQNRDPIYCEKICGSCDGLVLMLHSLSNCFLVVNPSTREVRKIPFSPFRINSGCYVTDYGLGLGYDYSIDDYKVVSICHYVGPDRCVATLVSVYALKTNGWRRIENSPCDHSRFGCKLGAFVCGALHWVAHNGTNYIIAALDLADEKFRVVPSPGCIGDRVCVLGGCLCVFVDRFDPRCQDVWVMKEYGVTDSWTKIITVFPYNGISGSCWRPLTLSRTGQVLLTAKEKKLGTKLEIFDPREGKSKELVVRGRPVDFEVGTYLETLVSPNRQCL